MKIGVIGAPGAGKTKFARAVAKNIDPPEDGYIHVVDGYAQKLQRDTGLALGYWASYAENFMIAGVRAAAEQKAGENRITVGTIVDTLLYCALKADVALSGTPEEKRAAWLGANSAMNAMALWYTESWDYDIAFYLPGAKNAKPGHDQWLQQALVSFGVPAFELRPGGDRVQLAKEIIRLVEEEKQNPEATPYEVAATVEQRLREGQRDGSQVGDPAESVPDLPSEEG